MENSENTTNALLELFYNAKERYGDEIESFWFYESDICPCCKKREIGPVKIGEEVGLSLNAFMYHDMNVLIGYLLCSYCINTLPGTSKKQKLMYGGLEQNLKDEYHNYLKSIAS